MYPFPRLPLDRWSNGGLRDSAAGVNGRSGSIATEMSSRAMSAIAPIATELRTSLVVRFVPIMLKKSPQAHERNFLAPLVRPTLGDVRDPSIRAKTTSDFRTCPTEASSGRDN